VAGLAAAVTGIALAGTARVEPHGIVIPALHDAASDRPLSYSPVCSHGAVPVCLQPAYRSFLPEVTGALVPLLGQLAGLPGAPVRVSQVVATSVRAARENGIGFGGPVIGGRPPVFYLPLAGVALPGEGNTSAAQFSSFLRYQYGPVIVNDLVGLPAGTVAIGVNPAAGPDHAAQFAVAQALDRALNLNPPPPPGTGPGVRGSGRPARSGPAPSTAQHAAVGRFAALSAAQRHGWLATHLAALRAGRITLSEIP
jgi:hypothetical protein